MLLTLEYSCIAFIVICANSEDNNFPADVIFSYRGVKPDKTPPEIKDFLFVFLSLGHETGRG